LLGGLHTARGFALEKAKDHAGAIAHFEQALALTRKALGSSSVELAMLLLNYGQIRAVDNLEAALGLVGEAKTILDRLHDKRANAALIVEAVILADHKRWPEVRKLLEQSLEHFDADTDPDQVATAKWTLARALVETHGERSRARKLASEARAGFVVIGPSEASAVADIDAWLAKL
jgi:tetratricopeptide (TPR) repeat protein